MDERREKVLTEYYNKELIKENRRAAHLKLGKYRGYLKVTWKKFDCAFNGGYNFGCGKCTVCRYGDYLEFGEAPKDDKFIEEYLEIIYKD